MHTRHMSGPSQLTPCYIGINCADFRADKQRFIGDLLLPNVAFVEHVHGHNTLTMKRAKLSQSRSFDAPLRDMANGSSSQG